MPRYTLVYFDIPGNRGEEIRLALHLAGQEFTDVRLKGTPAFARFKPKAPFGAVPFLEVEGMGTLGETSAILCYLGRAHGLHPTDPWQAARHEALMSATADVHTRIGFSIHTDDDAEKKRLREDLAADTLPSWAAAVEKQLGSGPFLAGDHPNVADIRLYMTTHWIRRGVLDHLAKDLFAPYPKLNALTDAFAAHPRVVDWKSRPTAPPVLA